MLALTKSILSIIHGLLKAILMSFTLDFNSYGQALTISPYFRCEDKYYLSQIRTSSQINIYPSLDFFLQTKYWPLSCPNIACQARVSICSSSKSTTTSLTGGLLNINRIFEPRIRQLRGPVGVGVGRHGS